MRKNKNYWLADAVQSARSKDDFWASVVPKAQNLLNNVQHLKEIYKLDTLKVLERLPSKDLSSVSQVEDFLSSIESLKSSGVGSHVIDPLIKALWIFMDHELPQDVSSMMYESPSSFDVLESFVKEGFTQTVRVFAKAEGVSIEEFAPTTGVFSYRLGFPFDSEQTEKLRGLLESKDFSFVWDIDGDKVVSLYAYVEGKDTK